MRPFSLGFVLLLSTLAASCGKANSQTVESIDCGYHYIAGRECIVCEKGGVSCKW